MGVNHGGTGGHVPPELGPAKTAEPIEVPFGVLTRVTHGSMCQIGVHIGSTWRIRLNRPCAAAMRPFCQITLTACYVIGQTIIFLPCDLYLSIFLSFLIPRLISAVGDWMSTILPHMVWP